MSPPPTANLAMTYAEARSYIEALGKRGWRLGLDRMQEFLRRIGDPHVGQKFFHVAGTNGKGSVTAMIASVLQHAGYRTGSYFSPYVYDFRERIQVNGEMIPEEEVARLTEFLMPISEDLALTDFGGPTEFEFKTAMGFLYWKEQNCDYVVLETGLGGRLDATNVVTPIVSVITEIGLDHQEHLGNTIEEIAREKAGIIKPGVPVVCGATDAKAFAVVRQVATERHCDFTPALGEVGGIGTKLWGDHQLRNTSLAAAALHASGVAISEHELANGMFNVQLSGRIEIYSWEPFVVLDGAHNVQAMRSVAHALRHDFGPRPWIVVYSAATGHDVRATLAELNGFAERIYAAPMSHPRSISADELHNHFPNACRSVPLAVEAALAERSEAEALLVTGSFYLLAEAKEALRTCGVVHG